MRFVLNGRFYGQVVTGVQRYARSLAAAGMGLDPQEANVALPGVGVVPLSEAAATSIPEGSRQGHFWEQLRLPMQLRADDLLVGLCNHGPVARRNQVVTIHDVSSILLPETFSARHRRVALLGVMAARRGRRIITGSERSKFDLINHYDFKPDLIDVVLSGVGPQFSPGDSDVDRPYCLFVGAHDPRKNLPFLKALWPEVERRTGLELVATGRATSRAHAAAVVEGVTVRNDLSDDELLSLYRGATLVLQPSRHEGFGLPILEGSACGTPFLSADVGAALELAVNPERQILALDAEAWISAIVAHTELDAASSRALIDGSLDVSARFTWESSARKLGRILRSVAQEMS